MDRRRPQSSRADSLENVPILAEGTPDSSLSPRGEREDKILRARAGDERALEDLIRECQQPVARFVAARIAGRSSDPTAVEDLCQGIFVKMVLSLSKLRAPEAFEPWLLRIAENACRDFQRRERWRRRLFVPLGDRHEQAQPEARAEQLQVARLETGLESLGASQRQLLALSLERPRSYEELASLTHLSVSALKSRLFRARANLRRLVGRGEDDHES
jgi:RNA polymerase sigma factor (sigma-70 family)